MYSAGTSQENCIALSFNDTSTRPAYIMHTGTFVERVKSGLVDTHFQTSAHFLTYSLSAFRLAVAEVRHCRGQGTLPVHALPPHAAA